MAKLIDRGAIMKQLKTGIITQKKAALDLRITDRWVRRIFKGKRDIKPHVVNQASKDWVGGIYRPY